MLQLCNLNIIETDKNKKRVDSMETMMTNSLESVKASCLKNKQTYITDIELAVGKRIMKSEEKSRKIMH